MTKLSIGQSSHINNLQPFSQTSPSSVPIKAHQSLLHQLKQPSPQHLEAH
jgi:hypothetical protein